MVDKELLVKTAKKIVSREDVKYVVGYKQGTYGFVISPSFAYTPEDVDNFIYNPLCKKNLTVYPILEEKLPLRREEEEDKRKIGIVVKGCDSRALVQIIQEKGLTREDLVIIGIPCKGVIDLKKIEKRFPNQTEAVNVVETDNAEYILNISGAVQHIPKEELLSEVCKSCEYPNPTIYDFLIGEKIEVGEVPEYSGLKNLDETPLEDRWAYWEKHFQNCIRCYACREACPLCYCKTCMADMLEPQWIRRSVNLSENTAWNIMRAFHLAGRCISCGECESVCPVNIPLMELNKKLEKDVKEMFKYNAGLDTKEKTLFGTFNTEEPEEFIM